MRVLYLCHRIPYPPNKGEKIRAFHQLRGLASQHELDLFTLVDDPADLAGAAALREFCRTVVIVPLNPRWSRVRALPYLFTRRPASVAYYYSSQLASAVRNAVQHRSYDRIFVYCSVMAQYLEPPTQIPAIVDLVDVDSDKWLQYAQLSSRLKAAVYRKEGYSLRMYETGICERFPSVLVSTEREAALLRSFCKHAPVHVVTNGVDTEYFQRAADAVPDNLPTVTFVGDMGYFPNQQAVTWFAHQVLPLVHQSCSDVRFLIVGRNPTAAVRALANLPGVHVTGSVPDVRTYLAQTHVSVAPFTIAMGVQNKILEAMSHALPIVATARAVQGLVPSVRNVIDVADTPLQFAARITDLLRDPEAARRKGWDGRASVERHYCWSRSVDQISRLLESA